MKTVGIVGLGLIGASFAKALKDSGSYRVLGFDIDDEVMNMALSESTIRGTLDSQSHSECDLLIIALYPSATVEYLKNHASELKQGCLVIDCCGVKRRVWDELNAICLRFGLIYVGGHPMAGLERSGYMASTASLFKNSTMILTPGTMESNATRAVFDIFFEQIGFSSVNWTTPELHDRVIAYTSQLAHVLSSAYVQCSTADLYRGFSAGSFQDMTRVAYLNAVMWTELFMENRDNLVREIEGLADRLLCFSAALRGGKTEKLREMLEKGSKIKFGLNKAGQDGEV